MTSSEMSDYFMPRLSQMGLAAATVRIRGLGIAKTWTTRGINVGDAEYPSKVADKCCCAGALAANY